MGRLEAIYFASDNLLEVVALRETATDTIVTGATVTAELLDRHGVSLGLGSISLAHVSGGLYRGTIPDTQADQLTDSGRYKVLVVADAGPGLHREWRPDLRVEQAGDG